MIAFPMYGGDFQRLPRADRLAVARHTLAAIETNRVVAIIRWLISLSEAALNTPHETCSNSDTDHDLYVRDAIELALAELPLFERDPYYAYSAGSVVVERLAASIANLIGAPQAFDWTAEELWKLARAVVK